MRVAICLILFFCLSSTTVAQDEHRLVISLDKQGAKYYRLTKFHPNYKPPTDYAGVFERSVDDIASMIGSHKGRLEISANQQEMVNHSYGQYLEESRRQLEQHSNEIFKMISSPEYRERSKLEQEIAKQEYKTQRRKLRERLRDDAVSTLQDVLVPRQREILNEIRLEKAIQKYGLAWSLTRKPISENLKLGKEQIKSLSTIKSEGEKELVEAFQEFEKRVNEIKNRSMTKMINRLNGTQRKKLHLSKEQILKIANANL